LRPWCAALHVPLPPWLCWLLLLLAALLPLLLLAAPALLLLVAGVAARLLRCRLAAG
jgi:uncharacterized protein (TIGR03382 family)